MTDQKVMSSGYFPLEILTAKYDHQLRVAYCMAQKFNRKTMKTKAFKKI